MIDVDYIMKQKLEELKNQMEKFIIDNQSEIYNRIINKHNILATPCGNLTYIQKQTDHCWHSSDQEGYIYQSDIGENIFLMFTVQHNSWGEGGWSYPEESFGDFSTGSTVQNYIRFVLPKTFYVADNELDWSSFNITVEK